MHVSTCWCHVLHRDQVKSIQAYKHEVITRWLRRWTCPLPSVLTQLVCVDARQFRAAIHAIAMELIDNNDILDGARIVQLVKECQVDLIPVDPKIDMEATALAREVTHTFCPVISSAYA